MTPEQRAEYNKNYYKNHKGAIIGKGNARISCKFCGSEMSRNNELKHIKTKLCAKRQAQKVQDIIRLNDINKQIQEGFTPIETHHTEN